MRIRAYLSVLTQPPMPALLLISLFAWLALLGSGHMMPASGQMAASGQMPAHNHTGVHTAGFQTAGGRTAIQSGWSWLLMLAAMMTPMLADAIRHLWVRSLPRRRLRTITGFALAYTTLWMLAGAVLMVAADGLMRLPGPGWPAPAISMALLTALVWQASPWKQACLNRCHHRPRLAPFGLAADRDSLRFGLVKGVWCVGSCWALMLLPLVFAQAELVVMLVVSVVLVGEQIQPGRAPRWRVPILPARFG